MRKIVINQKKPFQVVIFFDKFFENPVFFCLAISGLFLVIHDKAVQIGEFVSQRGILGYQTLIISF